MASRSQMGASAGTPRSRPWKSWRRQQLRGGKAHSRWLDPGHLPAHVPMMQIPASLRSLPNQLTVARILAIPVICLMIVIGWDWLRWLALIIYVAAAITDWLDGFLARRMNESSDLGKML